MDGEQIRQIRSGLGLSQEKFAQLLGVSLQTVRRWEKGISRPLPSISQKLAELGQEPRASRRRITAIPARRSIPPGGAVPPRGMSRAEADISGALRSIGSFVDLLLRFPQDSESGGDGEDAGIPISKTPGVYGLNVRLGPGGRPVIRQFGNIRDSGAGAVVSKTREPLVDVLDENSYILVIAELPGVAQEHISLKVTGDTLHLSAANGQRRYRYDIALPAPVDPDSLASSCRNGILEVRLARK